MSPVLCEDFVGLYFKFGLAPIHVLELPVSINNVSVGSRKILELKPTNNGMLTFSRWTADTNLSRVGHNTVFDSN